MERLKVTHAWPDGNGGRQAPSKANKRRILAILVLMAGSRCRVSFTDSEGVLHGVDVDAESLYEAVAVAVASLREDDVSPAVPGPTDRIHRHRL